MVVVVVVVVALVVVARHGGGGDSDNSGTIGIVGAVVVYLFTHHAVEFEHSFYDAKHAR